MVNALICLIPLCPLIACLTTAVLGARVLRERSHWPTIAGCGLAAACSLALLVCVARSPEPHRYTATLYQWVKIDTVEAGAAGMAALPDEGDRPQSSVSYKSGPDLEISIALRADSLAATMLAMLTFVSTCVAVYSAGYMHGERGYWRFFAFVSLFVFSMIMLVLSANFLQLYMFWEAVGLCSYLLIGFWYEKPAAVAASKKAFLVNRIGDFGFAIGVFLIWTTFGTLTFDAVLSPQRIAQMNPGLITLICLCLFTGAIGKSAQFPLHVWLPDAMEGPTPVSALIHAATMVTAGVYMVARCTPLFRAAPDAQVFVAFIGGFTALLAALIALTQYDLKRVLAYSTVSQLGYMFLGLGAGSSLGTSGAMFHLVTHAFFKALLFLGAGSVMHAMGGVIDMREFGGLRRIMPQTFKTFLIGSLALAGLPPLSGFWSKDTILSAAWEAGHAETHLAATNAIEAAPAMQGAQTRANVAAESEQTATKIRLFGAEHATIYRLLFWMGSFTALLTAFYTFRAFFLTFYGPEKIPHEAGHHAHESPSVMCMPLWVLSIGAAFLGLALGHLTGFFDGYLEMTLPGEGLHHATNWFVVGLSTVVVFAGIGAAWFMYHEPNDLPARVVALAGPLARLSLNKFYLDQVFFFMFVLPLRAASQLSRFFDWFVIDGMGVGGVSRLPAWLFGKSARPMQNGMVQFYALSMTLATAVLLAALLWRQG